ncbi:hypothetical protein B7463_g5772, partial [Scytalidium lignicola]
MEIADVADQYFTYQDRLASFQVAHPLPKRRGSNANSKAPKSLKWPHKFLSADALAKAGFFYHPLEVNPDNVACFLCHSFLDGWEKGDDPLAEHLKLSPDCGWAILATIEAQDEDLSEHNPLSPEMVSARKATFADKWPYESKKGWKCKVKQMVDAGWMYTPMPESDDMATCVYCQLALDGWEPSDKPWDEHHVRSPGCSFFMLAEEHKQSRTSKNSRAKKDRTSKQSRLSTQSAFTTASEAPSFIDLPVEDQDSILTTSTSASTTQSVKKMAKEKKGSTKARKTKAKKSEAVEIVPPESEYTITEIKPNSKTGRGRKRKSDEVTDANVSVVDVEAPPPKRRNTRMRGSLATNESVSNIQGQENTEQQLETGRRRGRSSTTKASRKASVSKKESLSSAIPNDEEIDRALEADLERELTEDEDNPPVILPKKTTRPSKATKAGYDMFDPEPAEIDEAIIDAEIDAIELESKPLPKTKGGKAKTTRKVSAKQQAAAAKKKAVMAEAEAAAHLINDSLQNILEPVTEIAPARGKRAASRQLPQQPPAKSKKQSTLVEQKASSDDDTDRRDSMAENDDSIISQSTVIRGEQPLRESILKNGLALHKDKGKDIEETLETAEDSVTLTEIHPPPARIIKGKKTSQVVKDAHLVDEKPTSEPEHMEDSIVSIAPPTKAPKARGRPQKAAAHIPQPTTSAVGAPRSPSPSPREATPSQSPQSSDAENHPPSSKPSMAKSPLPPVSRTPLEAKTPTMSPSKRNVISGLQSTEPWTAVDLDTFLQSPGSKGPGLFDPQVENLKNGELTTPEKKMSVEEWIYHNAQLAEEKLRNECEKMVGDFEREGGRAMRALEGLISHE